MTDKIKVTQQEFDKIADCTRKEYIRDTQSTWNKIRDIAWDECNTLKDQYEIIEDK